MDQREREREKRERKKEELIERERERWGNLFGKYVIFQRGSRSYKTI
jgi:hypothetical protein